MSSKVLAARYNGHSSGGSGSGILGLIGALGGAGDITGGLTTMPDGSVTFSPATVAHPFFDRLSGGKGSQEAEALNRYILGLKYSNQLDQGNIKLKGEEERKTLGEQGTQERKTLSDKQITDVMKAAGVPDSPENRALFSSAISQSRINTAKAQSDTEAGLYSSKEGQDAYKRNLLATMLAPEVKNTKDLTVQTPANTLTTMPTGEGFAPVNNFTKISGPMESKTATEVGGFTDPKTGITMGAKPLLQTTFTGGSIMPGTPVGKIDLNAEAPVANSIKTMPTITGNFDSGITPEMIQAFNSSIFGNQQSQPATSSQPQITPSISRLSNGINMPINTMTGPAPTSNNPMFDILNTQQQQQNDPEAVIRTLQYLKQLGY